MQKIAYDFNRLKAEQIEVIPQTNRNNSATFIFFHGSGECLLESFGIFFAFLRFVTCAYSIGDSACNFREWISYLASGKPEYKHIKVLYPNATLQPYTPLNGQV